MINLPAMKLKLSLYAAVISLALIQHSQGALIINIVESGSDVVATLSGSINDLTGTTVTSTQPDSFSSFIRPNSGVIGFSPNSSSVNYNIYNGFSAVPAAYGTSNILAASSLTGSDRFYIRNNPLSPMFLPTSYILGTPMSATATYSGQSFASLGLTAGTYVWSWTGDSVTLNVGAAPSPVPEPGQVAASLLVLAGIGGFVWLKRRNANKSALATA